MKLRMSVDYAENTRHSVTRARSAEQAATDAAAATLAADGFATVGRNGKLRQRVRVR